MIAHAGPGGPAQAREGAQWLSARELSLRMHDAALRSWLTTPGLLTERVRAAVGPQFRLRVLEEGLTGDDFVRRIELGRAGEPWIYAETSVPATTLAQHPWLATIGERSLGEVLAEFRGPVTRSELEFAWLDGDSPLVARAVALAAVAARPLWARRSTIRAGAHPFVVREVFLPVVAERGA